MPIMDKVRIRISADRRRDRLGVLMIAGLLCLGPLACGVLTPSKGAASAPPAGMQSFADIVKKVTPAVVNVAVVGGAERREGGPGPRRPLPPGPFGGPGGPGRPRRSRRASR